MVQSGTQANCLPRPYRIHPSKKFTSQVKLWGTSYPITFLLVYKPLNCHFTAKEPINTQGLINIFKKNYPSSGSQIPIWERSKELTKTVVWYYYH